MLASRRCAAKTPLRVYTPRLRHYHVRGALRAPEAASLRAPSRPPGIKTLGVVGAGQMGMGIAQVAAQVAKVDVLVMDANKANLDKSLAFMGTASFCASDYRSFRRNTSCLSGSSCADARRLSDEEEHREG